MKMTLLNRVRQGALTLAASWAVATSSQAQTTTTDDHGNNATAATLVTLPATQNGVLERSGDVDWFKFTLTAPALVTVTSGGTTDVVGTLLIGGARGAVTPIYSDNDSAGAPNFRLQQQLPAGTHYVYVNPLVYGTLGAYTVDFQTAPPSTTQPEIAIAHNGADYPAGTLMDFGTAPVGSVVSKDFVIANTGDADLAIQTLRLSVTGTLPTGTTFPFRIASSPAKTLQPGRQTTFRLSFQANVAATFNGRATVVSSDSDEIFYEIPLRGTSNGTLPAPEIVIRDGTAEVANNGTINVGATQVGVRLLKTVTIANTGSTELRLSSYIFTPVNGSVQSYSILGNPAPTAVPAGGQGTFQIALYNLSAGTYSSKLAIQNNDTNENPTFLTFTGTVTPDPVAGEIAVAVGGTDAPNNSTVDFGNNVTGAVITKDFIVTNPGTTTLKLTGLSFLLPPATTVPVATTISSGSTTGTVATAASLTVGMGVYGPFPAGTSVTAITGTSVTFSSAATTNISNATLSYVVGGPSATVNPFGLNGSYPTTLAAGGSATIKINYAPLQAGDHRVTLRLFNNDSDENPYSLTLTGHTDVNPNPGDIAVSLDGSEVAMNSDVDWGSVPVGTTAQKFFTITNSGTGDLRFTGWQASPMQPALSTTVPLYFLISGLPTSTLPAGQTATVAISFKPLVAGTSYRSSIFISSTDPDENPYRFNATGTGGAVTTPAAEIAVSINNAHTLTGGSFTFGNVNSGTPLQRQFTINNLGNAPLTVSGVSVNPAVGSTGAQNPFIVMFNAPLTIPSGGSAGGSLNFAATTAGDYAATLQILSNDSDEGTFIVNLTGTAVGTVAAPEVGVAVAGTDLPSNGAVAFGEAATGTTITKQFTISNTGNAALNLNGWGFQYPNGSIVAIATTTTAGSVTGTVSTADATRLVAGMTVANSGFPGGTTVVSVSGTSVTFSAAALSSLTNTFISYFQPGIPPIMPFRFEGVTPSSIAAGATATVNVVYAPVQAGAHNVALRFHSNDINESPYFVNLSASATGPTLAPEVGVSLAGVDVPINSTVAFGSTSVSTLVSKQFVISNSGNLPLTISQWYFINPVAPTVVTTTTTNGSAIASVTNSANLAVGMIVTGPFPAGTTIASVNSPTSITLSAAASASATNVGYAYYPVGTNLYNPFSFSGTLPSSIAAGGSATVTVRYAPNATGSHSMKLGFNNNDSNEGSYQIILTGNAVANTMAPEISVFTGTVEQPRGSIINFGTVASGTLVSRDFIVKNTGTANLNVSGLIEVIAPLPVAAPPAFSYTFVSGNSSIAPGASATMRVTFRPMQVSTSYSSTFRINNNDADENPYSFTINGASNALEAEINVAHNGSDLPSGSTIDFGTDTLVGAQVTKSFIITNTGTAPLSTGFSWGRSVGTIGASPSSPFAMNTTGSIAAGASATITINYRPITAGPESWTITIANNDISEGNYKINLTATAIPNPTPPEIALSVGGVDIASGGTLAFSSSVGVSTFKDILITNTGTSDLRLASYAFSAVTPAGASFNSAPPTGIIPPGGSMTWRLNFLPTTAGSFTTQIRSFNSDPDESTFLLNITGTTTAP